MEGMYLDSVKNPPRKASKNLFGISWDVEGENIIQSNILLTGNINSKEYKDSIETIKKLLRKTMPPNNLRPLYWLKASGAYREKQNNKDYYNNILNNYPETIPQRYLDVIEADISRTFPEEKYFKNAENVKKLQNILIAYSRRNTNVGYVQGFNFIVGRLLTVTDNEEDSFWLFSALIENILPVEYFNECCGLMGDCALTLKLLKDSEREEIKHLDKLGFEMLLNNLIYRWFLSVFVENTSYETFLCIWDALFIEGNIVLFRSAFALLSMISKDIIKSMTIEDTTALFENKISHFSDYAKLMKLILAPETLKIGRFNYNMKDICQFRKKTYEFAYGQIKTSKNNMKHIEKHDNENTKKEGDSQNENDSCDTSWPFCLNKANTPIINEAFVIRTHKKIKIENLFYIDREIINIKIKEYQDKVNKKNESKNRKNYNELATDSEKIKDKLDCYSNMLIERNTHNCNSNKCIFNEIGDNENESNSSIMSNKSSINKSLLNIYNIKATNTNTNINFMIDDIEKSEQMESAMTKINMQKVQRKKSEDSISDDAW